VKCLTCSCTSCDADDACHATGMSNVNWVQQSAEETVNFVDNEIEANLGWKIADTALQTDDEQTGADIQQFLARPVRIATRNWAISDAAYTKVTVYPWQAFLSNARVVKKIANFAYLRGNLKIRVLCNASPFYYGAMRVCYQPLPGFRPETILSTGQQSLIPLSQRAGFMIRPGQNESYVMSLPFFLPTNKLDVAAILNGGSAASDMGKLDYVIFAALQSANSVASATVTVDTYAWLEDVELTSYTLAPQSAEQDEYGEGVVSKPATALATLAANYKNTPGIGKFATATEIGARAVANIARLFGYTNVPVVSDTQPYKPEPFPHFAAADVGYPLDKLTLDSKAELSVQPMALGMSPEDEMSVSTIAGRDSFIAAVPWATTGLEDDLLFSTRVTPVNYSSTGDNVNTIIDMTPASMLACAHKSWRGDLIYTFDVIASPYHKGRLIISHDPSGTSSSNILTTAATTNAVLTSIVDISETTKFEMRVPYQQPTTYAYTRAGGNSTFLVAANKPWAVGGTPVTFTSNGDCNGHLTIRIQTVLSAPVAVAPVTVLVSVRAAENFELANPCNPPVYLSNFVAQAEEIDLAHDVDTVTPRVTIPARSIERNRMHYGEAVASIRPLLRRMSYLGAVTPGPNGGSASTTDWLVQYRFRRMPPSFGYDPNGLNSAVGLVATGSTFSFNFVNPVPLTWFMSAFVAYRGSINWSFDVNANGKTLSNISVIRDPSASGTTQIATTTAGSTSGNQRVRLYSRNSRNTFGGTTLTHQLTQAGVNVSLPNMTQYKFQSTDLTLSHTGTSADGSNYELMYLEVKDEPSIVPSDVIIHEYVGAGADFNLHYFLNVPSWYNYGSYPSAP